MHSGGCQNPQRMMDHIFQIEIQDKLIFMNMHVNYFLFISLIGACRCMGGRVGGQD